MKNTKSILTVILISTLSSLLVSCASSSKDEAMAKPVPESVIVDNKTLVTKGHGFRIIETMGIAIKLYKFGFYVEDLKLSADDLIEKNKVSHLYMRHVFQVAKYLAADGWADAYKLSCMEDCQNTQTDMKKFLDFLPGPVVGDEMEITFKPTGVLVQTRGKKNDKIEIASPAFSRNLLRVFIGPKVGDKKFKALILGEKP